MSMNMLTLLQLIGIFCAYLLVTLGLPAFVLEGKFKTKFRLTERFLLYFMTGNFYIMNLVFVLQLLKISNPVTLILGTLLPAAWAWVVLNQIPVKRIFAKLSKTMRRVSTGLMGWKTLLLRITAVCGKAAAAFGRMISRFLFRRTIDTLLVLLLLAALIWLYGGNILQYYGYKASDLLVHNYWINALNDNKIFVAGVYPHGFHCIVYYLHAVFGFDTYVILRVFAFPQNVMIHLMLLAFLKLCCKTRYAAYLGIFLYTVGGFFAENTYSRYYATLPQEFGMLFILPAVYCGFAFFAVKRDELAEEGFLDKKETEKERTKKKFSDKELQENEFSQEKQAEKKLAEKKPRKLRDIFSVKNFRSKKLCLRKSHVYLAGFAMSFSMTLAVHFYGTMIAGLFSVAMAAGYCFLFFRKKYFWNVVCTCAVSVVIAVLPMLLAFLGGTPLQGSLGWGLNVITGGSQSSSNPANTGAPSTGVNPSGEPAGGSVGGEGAAGSGSANTTGETGVPDEDMELPKVSLAERLHSLAAGVIEKLKAGWQAVYQVINGAVLRLRVKSQVYWIMYSFFVLIGLGLVFCLLKRKCYGAMLISVGVYMIFISVMLAARAFGLPPLMDSNRGSIYFAYSLPIVAAFLTDAVLTLCFLPMKRKLVVNLLSLACVILAVGYLWQNDRLKKPRDTKAQIMNENVVCLTNIIKNEKDYTWTIVSANDETQMGVDHGYHYETIVFLESMEHSVSDAMIRIPTQVVYFFIEKYPVDYSIRYMESGQPVSEKGAANPLPANSGIRMYQGEKRWIVMSRMYYWAQEFQRLYPNEMDVYLETDQFICYRIEQNPYRLYNFAIDYGYNTADQEDF